MRRRGESRGGEGERKRGKRERKEEEEGKGEEVTMRKEWGRDWKRGGSGKGREKEKWGKKGGHGSQSTASLLT